MIKNCCLLRSHGGLAIGWLCVVWLIFSLASAPAQAERHALLVGVGDYPQSALDLLGPENDINALHKILLDTWQFDQKNIVVLKDQQATKAAVLAELRNLKTRSKPGDQLFFYFSGHGTSARDEAVQLPLPDMTAGLLPYDAKLNLSKHEIVASLIVGRSDLRPIFKDIDESGRDLLVMIDACYSGNAVRGLSLPGQKMPSRFVQLDNSVDTLFPETSQIQTRAIAASASEEAYPYENVFFIAASGEYEVAADISGPYLKKFPTIDGKPHGAFSDAMLRVLSGTATQVDLDGNGVITHLETKQGILDWMAGKFPQTPQHLPPAEEDTANLASRSIFGTQSLPGTIVKARPQSALAEAAPASQPVSLASTLPAATSQATQTVQPQVQATQQSQPQLQNAQSSQSVASAPQPPAGFKVALDPALASLKSSILQIPGTLISDVYPDIRLLPSEQGVELRNGANDLIIAYPTGFEQELVARIDQEVQVRQFLDRLKRDRSFDISVDVKGKQQNGLHLGGEMASFTVRTGENAWLVLLDIDREGGINVLFPAFAHEQRLQPASLVLETPAIEVVAPFGSDRIVALGFREKPTALFDWLGELTPRISPRTPRIAEFYNLVNQYSGQSAFQELPFITADKG